MKIKYIDVMEKTLAAYTQENIEEYFGQVKEEGITEHGFPRLVANIGILIAKGRRHDLLGSFLDMMDFVTSDIPRRTGRGGNDFSVREIISAILELEATDIVSKERIARWRANLSRLVPAENYREIATPERDYVGNWAAYNAASEVLRVKSGIAADTGFIDMQIESQLRNFDENGMYMDPNEPMLYDLASRAQFAVMLHYGYDGKYAAAMDEKLEKSGELTLRMQSLTGAIPFGGRSNQMLFNEAYLAAVLEYEASRYASRGESETASRFKAGAKLALDCILRNLKREPLTHVKNFYPKEDGFGCEGYAYFDKYMITLASFSYLAYIFANDSVEPAERSTSGAFVTETSDKFHKIFMEGGGYFLEFDTCADPHYDATGLGRVHKEGAPEALVLSVPFAQSPQYKIGDPNPSPLALTSNLGDNVRYALAEEGNVNAAIYAYMNIERDGKVVAVERYMVDEDGVNVITDTEGETEYNIPAFLFDGERYTNTTLVENTLRVYYRGYVAEYSSPDAEILDTGLTYRNRNGVYRLYKARSTQRVSLHIRIYEGTTEEI